MKKQTFELIVARLLLVISSISRLVSRFWRSEFFSLKGSYFVGTGMEGVGFVTQLSIVLFATTTLWVSAMSLLPVENVALVEIVLKAPTSDEVVTIEPDSDKKQPLLVEPMRLFAINSDFDKIIVNISRELGVDPALVKAVIHSESAFDQFAVSSRGANGLMQLMPETAVRFAITDPFNAEQNIRGGVRFLRHLLLTFENDERLAIAAYNAGPGRVLYYGDVPPFVETYTFVYKVLELRKLYADIYSDPEDETGESVALLEVSIST